MIIIIGDAEPNTVEDVKFKRERAAKSQKKPNYWSGTQYKEPTHWLTEIDKIKDAEVPVHSFYVLNDKLEAKEKEKEKKRLKAGFEQLSVNGGKCQFLDIHNEKEGQEDLKNLFMYYILYRTTEINLGKDAAEEATRHIQIRHT